MLPDIQPGNTKILYFFNCLLDGMHTIPLSSFCFSKTGNKECQKESNLIWGRKGGVLCQFQFSSVLNSTFFPTSQTNILLFLFIILGYNDYEKVCLCN